MVRISFATMIVLTLAGTIFGQKSATQQSSTREQKTGAIEAPKPDKAPRRDWRNSMNDRFLKAGPPDR